MTEYRAGAAHVYRMQWWRRISPMFFVGIGLTLLWAYSRNGIDFQDQKQLISTVVAIAIFLVGCYITANAFRALITLGANAIEVRTLTATRRLPFTAIRGRREYVVNTGRTRTRYLRLEPNDARLPTLDFEKNFAFDQSFYAWFNALPDLDELDKRALKTSEFGLV